MNCPKGRTKVVVLCGEPTKPPHTDEKNPGTCSRPRAFCLPKGAATPDWKCWQHGGTNYNHKYTDSDFKDCADAVKKFNDQKTAGDITAKSMIFIKADATDVTTVANANGTYTSSTVPHFIIDRDGSYVAGIHISWPNMTAEDHAAVTAATDALEAHEQRHFTIAEEFLEEKNHGSSVSGTGKTKADAMKAMNANRQALTKQYAGELQTRQDAYDDETTHGTNQSAIGGVDVKLICPDKK